MPRYAVDTFLGDLAHPDWADYVATNLLDALVQVPDTGDWHGALRAWCQRTMTGKISPNRAGAFPLLSPDRGGPS